jgi:hypothetical protein
MFRTTRCAMYGQSEVTLQLSTPVPIPGVETMLLRYFEEAAAAGTRFLAGETVRLGWSTLKLIARDDGTLGVQALDLEHLPQWHESVSQTLLEAWRQNEVARSVGLAPVFPSQLSTAIVCTQWKDTVEFALDRKPPQGDEDSGWFIGCTDPEHDHEAEQSLLVTQLINVAAWVPPLAQFLALPPGVEVLMRGPGRVMAKVWFGGKALTAADGSYLAALGEPSSAIDRT